MYAQIKTLRKGEAVIECKLRINDRLLNHEIEFKINAREMVSNTSFRILWNRKRRPNVIKQGNSGEQICNIVHFGEPSPLHTFKIRKKWKKSTSSIRVNLTRQNTKCSLIEFGRGNFILWFSLKRWKLEYIYPLLKKQQQFTI